MKVIEEKKMDEILMIVVVCKVNTLKSMSCFIWIRCCSLYFSRRILSLAFASYDSFNFFNFSSSYYCTFRISSRRRCAASSFRGRGDREATLPPAATTTPPPEVIVSGGAVLNTP